MLKIDKRKKYLIGIDTETCGGMVDGKLTASAAFVYDIGYVVTDKKGRIYLTRSFIVSEVYDGMKELMSTCYYKDKLPRYVTDIESGKRIKTSIFEVLETMRQDMKDYNISTVFAHNAYFDVMALNNTINTITSGGKKYFFPYGTMIWDTLKMSRDVIVKTPTYSKYCYENGFLTERYKKPKATAEVLYRYIAGNDGFIESHTGLEDVLIETMIMAYCFRKHKAMRKELFNRKAD